MKTSGIYLLTIRLKKQLTLEMAKSAVTLQAGFYCYVGSALNGLEGRLNRHLRTSQVKHWHVDHLLVHGKVVDIQILRTTSKEAECSLASQIAVLPDAQSIDGFGASDCQCHSHLFYFTEKPYFSIYSKDILSHIDQMMKQLNTQYTNHAIFERNPFETLITCVLSLRTKDPVTHAAAKRLFEKLKKLEDFVGSSPAEIAELIFPVGMYKQKSVRLIEISQMILGDFGGTVPDDIDQLLALPGVGRKTANLVRSFSFHLPAICVDTHVHRIANRWGLLRTAEADDTEMGLRKLLPERYWIELNPLLVQHGQQVCFPRNPCCPQCGLREYCNYDELRQDAAVLEPVEGVKGHPSLVFSGGSCGKKKGKMLSPFE